MNLWNCETLPVDAKQCKQYIALSRCKLRLNSDLLQYVMRVPCWTVSILKSAQHEQQPASIRGGNNILFQLAPKCYQNSNKNTYRLKTLHGTNEFDGKPREPPRFNWKKNLKIFLAFLKLLRAFSLKVKRMLGRI